MSLLGRATTGMAFLSLAILIGYLTSDFYFMLTVVMTMVLAIAAFSSRRSRFTDASRGKV